MAAVPRMRVEWFDGAIALITTGVPLLAHQQATAAAAQAAAAAIGGNGTGRLAADVRTPKPLTAMSSLVGSDLPYANIQNQGGTIHGNPTLYIKGIGTAEGYIAGRRYPAGFEGGLGGQFGTQDIVATAAEVTIPAKNYLAWAPPTYEITLLAALRSGYA